MFVIVVPYVFVIMPATGVVSNVLVDGVGFICMSGNLYIRMSAGFLGAFLFLPLVSMGMHHGLAISYITGFLITHFTLNDEEVSNA